MLKTLLLILSISFMGIVYLLYTVKYEMDRIKRIEETYKHKITKKEDEDED